ncbi:MAG: DUF433 domain-containing protein [Candidatus Kapaibacterium sp.]|nr:MAG: DUF433 domain-containing protein [Candidatus Kapabacteria bacterium]
MTINSEIRFGKPCIKGTCIVVHDIWGWLASGVSVEKICTDFPELSEASIKVVLSYAADKERRTIQTL